MALWLRGGVSQVIFETRLHQGSSSRWPCLGPKNRFHSFQGESISVTNLEEAECPGHHIWCNCLHLQNPRQKFSSPQVEPRKTCEKLQTYTNYMSPGSRSTKIGNKHCLLNEGFPNWPMIVPIMGSIASQIIINQSTSLCFVAQRLQHLLKPHCWTWICSHGRNWSCQIWIVVQ